MQKPTPEFDTAEQEIEEQELAAALAIRKSSCPPPDVLLAVGQEVLPSEIEEAAARHLAVCKLCSGLLADLATLPEAAMTISEQQRIASRVPALSSRGAGPGLRVLLAIAAILVLCIGGLAAWRARRGEPVQTAQHPAANPVVPPANVAELSIPLTPLAPPSDAAIVTRGGQGGNAPSTAELLPAFIAYNHADYRSAAQRFAALSSLHPKSATIRLYLGVSELYLGQDQQAGDNLRLAESAAATGSAKDAARWYGAIAASHLHATEARTLLLQLCHDGASAYSRQSCAILQSAK